MTIIISRQEAKRLGLIRYFTGVPCNNGHVCERLTSDTHCVKCNSMKSVKNKRRRRLNNEEYRILDNRKRHIRSRDTAIKRRRWNQYYYNRTVLESRLRNRLYKAIRGLQKTGSAVRDLGMPIPQFKEYIASKFHDGMAWENWGILWELDHKVPLANFNLRNHEELLKAVHYDNLQPLLIEDHRKKTILENSIRFSRAA